MQALSAAKGAAPPCAVSPLAGVWALNPDKTQTLAAEDFERALVEIVITDRNVTLTDVMVDTAARVDCRSNELRVDGLEHSGSHGYALVASWIESRTLEVVVKKDNKTVSRVTYGVSPGGATLLVEASTLAHDGYPAVSRTMVFDRIESSRAAAEEALVDVGG